MDQAPYWVGRGGLQRVNFILTNKCNLRCVYCPQGSHPDDYHTDLSDEAFEAMLGFLAEKKIKEVGLGYYGEMTLVDRWWEKIARIADMGIDLVCTTNAARVLSAEEVAVFARFKYIELSIDTHDQKILQKIRKRVDVANIVHNFHLIRSFCRLHDMPCPEIVWTGVLTHYTVETLPEFVAFAASNGTSVLKFNEVGIYAGAAEKGLSIVSLDGADFHRAVARMEDAIAAGERLGVHVTFNEMPRVRVKQEMLARGETFHERLAERSTPVNPALVHIEGHAIPPGHTKACSSPWQEMYHDPKGRVYACCTRGDVMGIAKTTEEFDAVWNGPAYVELRRSLSTGIGLDRNCATCTIRPTVPVTARRASPMKTAERWFRRRVRPLITGRPVRAYPSG